MRQSELPEWVAAAASASVRLAAEAGAEADELLGEAAADGSSSRRMSQHVSRLEQSAEVNEVATDLAALLWAECGEVPRITAILEEPTARAALEAVAEARRVAARRVADSLASSARGPLPPPERPLGAAEIRLLLERAAAAPAADAPKGDVAAAAPAAPADQQGRQPVSEHAAGPTARPAVVPPAAGMLRTPTAGAVLAGAVAAVLVLGHRLRRA